MKKKTRIEFVLGLWVAKTRSRSAISNLRFWGSGRIDLSG